MAQGHVVRFPMSMANTSPRMEDVLDLYAETPDPAWPLVCFDETPVQLIGEARRPVPAQPGQRERYDYEYRRNGTVNLFVTFDPASGLAQRQGHRPPRRHVDYAQCMRELVERPLSRRRPASVSCRTICRSINLGRCMRPSRPAEARRILRRLEFHFAPETRQLASTWSSARSACCSASVSAAAFLDDPKKLRATKSQHGNGGEK